MVRIGDPSVDTPVTSNPRFSMMLAIRSPASVCPLAFTNSVAIRTGAEEVVVGLGATGFTGAGAAGFVGVVTPGFAGDVVPGFAGVVIPGFAGVLTGGFSPGFNGLVLSMPG